MPLLEKTNIHSRFGSMENRFTGFTSLFLLVCARVLTDLFILGPEIINCRSQELLPVPLIIFKIHHQYISGRPFFLV